MMLDPEGIFADLISFREEIHAPEVHMDYTVKSFRFVLYTPTGTSFHFMPCSTVRRAAILRRTSRNPGLKVCGNCINAWNNRFPDRPLTARTFDLEQFFAQLEYDPDMWDGIDIPPEEDESEFMSGCFLLYRPVRNNPFHFMRCRKVRYDESIGWIKAYRFTDRISGKFEMFDGKTYALRPCEDCLTEWNGGIGWKGYSNAPNSEKEDIRSGFNIREFFGECNHQEHRPKEFTELYSLMDDYSVWFGTNIDNEYPRNWPEISAMYRIAQSYRCEQCGLDMTAHPDLAVVHHVNGSHPEVGPDNMKVLCVWCHSKQPHHEVSVKLDRYTLRLLRKLRQEQGIK